MPSRDYELSSDWASLIVATCLAIVLASCSSTTDISTNSDASSEPSLAEQSWLPDGDSFEVEISGGRTVTVLDSVEVSITAADGGQSSSGTCQSGSDYREIVTELREFQRALATGNPEEVAPFMRFPVNWNDHDPKLSVTESEFGDAFAQMFSEPYIEELVGLDVRALSCNIEGHMIGNGTVWGIGNSGIYAVNGPWTE